MPGQTRSRTASVLVVSFLLALLSSTADAQIRFDLPAQPLAQALTAVGNIANLNIYFDATVVDGIRSPALKAELSADDALAKLLVGTRLHAVRVDENTIRVVAEAESKHAQTTRDPPTGAASRPAAVHLASAAVGSEGSVNTQAIASAADDYRHQSGGLSEVVVTAQKRTENIQDVPVPVTEISAATLQDSNLLRIEDYYTLVPGLTVTPDDFNGAGRLAIRGLTTGGYTNPTVGIVVDDLPYGSTTSNGAGWAAPDIDPSELSSIEVLRGPQGTLYGASSIGGLLKFVTVDPSTDVLTGRVQAGVSSVYNGAQLGYNVRGAVNVPLSDTLAVRASGFTRQDPGYIDDPGLGQRGVNKTEVAGGRLSALWRPSDTVSLKIGALYQSARANGSSNVDIGPGLGDLQQDNAIKGAGGFNKKDQEYSATLKAKLGSIDLTSISGYGINTYSNLYDLTFALGPTIQYGSPGSGFNGFGVPGTPWVFNYRTNKFSEEIRLAAALGKRVDWLFGAFYTHENSPYSAAIEAAQVDGTVLGTFADERVQNKYEEYAAFGDVTVHITDQFDIQVGGRESESRQSYSENDTGPEYPLFYGVSSPLFQPQVDSKDNSFTYLVTPQFKISPDIMAYARLASGYRPGGINQSCTILKTSCRFSPDKTQNYEVGAKGNLLEHLLSFDASIYYIDWRDVQELLIDPVTLNGYTANGGRAKSQGVELSLVSRPLRGLTISAWVAWNEAVLTKGFPLSSTASGGAYGAPGDRLPYSPHFSGNLSLDENFPIADGVSGFVGGSLSYVGYREDLFTQTAERQALPMYAQTDLRGGARYATWTINLYVNNLADKRALLTGGVGTVNPVAFQFIQPRTVGLNVIKTF